MKKKKIVKIICLGFFVNDVIEIKDTKSGLKLCKDLVQYSELKPIGIFNEKTKSLFLIKNKKSDKKEKLLKDILERLKINDKNYFSKIGILKLKSKEANK